MILLKREKENKKDPKINPIEEINTNLKVLTLTIVVGLDEGKLEY